MLANADTKGMRGGEQRERRREGNEPREHEVKMNTSGLRGGVQQEVRKREVVAKLCEFDESENTGKRREEERKHN